MNETGTAPSVAPAPANIAEYTSEASLSTYPKPVHDQLNLRVSGVNGQATITITDAQGKLLRTISEEFDGSEKVMNYDVNDFAQGLYFVNVRSNDTTISQKFVVTK